MRIRNHGEKIILRGFRVMLFRMVPKQKWGLREPVDGFRVMLFSFRKYDMIDVKISLICTNMVII